MGSLQWEVNSVKRRKALITGARLQDPGYRIQGSGVRAKSSAQTDNNLLRARLKICARVRACHIPLATDGRNPAGFDSR
ncbi:MAG: hypothetical protein CVV64_17500 [Candidatus Wallbacteria bacterium HGW-Wallbacteria-1]|uniref:Uncharacterized protein n=1 Tax=Candidatus Wallbacteria bacterium HGW-Wallbacteria-1 TaxID=2013854 RepID=A0A2N1PK50_9BACT|nr:MAG: hypothetical protein CVV64_17500 [Candidatus Wallbacteria bacterium HGW-Wallbacteria-1]